MINQDSFRPYVNFPADLIAHGVWAGLFYLTAGSLGIAATRKRTKSLQVQSFQLYKTSNSFLIKSKFQVGGHGCDVCHIHRYLRHCLSTVGYRSWAWSQHSKCVHHQSTKSGLLCQLRLYMYEPLLFSFSLQTCLYIFSHWH